MSKLAAPDDRVVIRSSRLMLVVGVVVLGFLAYGIGRGLFALAFDHAHAARDMSVGEQVASWILGVPLGLLAAIGVVVLAPRLRSRPVSTVLDGDRVVFSGGTITRAGATSIDYLPGQQTTWSGPTRRGDHSIRGVGRSRLQTRLVVQGAGTYCEFSSLDRSWPQVVEILRQWAAARPELVGSEESREFLLRAPGPSGPASSVVRDLATAEKHPTWRRRWWLALWCACSVAVYVPLLVLFHRLGSWADISTREEWHFALVSIPGAVLMGGLVAVLVAPMLGFVGLCARAVRAGDPWSPFVADDLGRYHWMVSGQLTLLRAGHRRTPFGLLLRWLGLLLPTSLPVLLVLMIVSRT